MLLILVGIDYPYLRRRKKLSMINISFFIFPGKIGIVIVNLKKLPDFGRLEK